MGAAVFDRHPPRFSTAAHRPAGNRLLFSQFQTSAKPAASFARHVLQPRVGETILLTFDKGDNVSEVSLILTCKENKHRKSKDYSFVRQPVDTPEQREQREEAEQPNDTTPAKQHLENKEDTTNCGSSGGNYSEESIVNIGTCNSAPIHITAEGLPPQHPQVDVTTTLETTSGCGAENSCGSSAPATADEVDPWGGAEL